MIDVVFDVVKVSDFLFGDEVVDDVVIFGVSWSWCWYGVVECDGDVFWNDDMFLFEV